VSKLTHIEKITAEALQQIRDGTVPPIPPALAEQFAIIARRNPQLVADTHAIIRRTIEKTTN
jgi:hypothetical protein